MQSKTSFFNRTLFRKNLTRFWPLWGGASFLGSLFPLALLLQLMRGWMDLINPLAVTEAYYSVLCYAVPILSLLYAILCAMLVWSYLYNSRSVGLMHTLPITRKGVFITNFLSGMAMVLIPYAIVGTLCILISLAYGVFEPVGLLVTILGVLGESFFYFASATFVAFMVGNTFALPAVYFLLHFLAPLLDWLISTFAGNFLFGLNSYYSGVVDFLSPTVYLMERVNVNCTYENIITQTSITGAYSETNRLTAVTLENAWLIGVYALVGVALLALAWVLYARRRSESAGDVVAVGWMKPVFRFGIAALTALLGGQALYALFWSSFQDGAYYDALPMVVCMLVAGTTPPPCSSPNPSGCSGAAGRALSWWPRAVSPCAASCGLTCWASPGGCRRSTGWRRWSSTPPTIRIDCIPVRTTPCWRRCVPSTRPSWRTRRTSGTMRTTGGARW